MFVCVGWERGVASVPGRPSDCSGGCQRHQGGSPAGAAYTQEAAAGGAGSQRKTFHRPRGTAGSQVPSPPYSSSSPPLSNSTNPSGSPPFWLQSLCLWAQCGYEVAARVLPYPIIKTLILVSFELPGRSGMITMGRKCWPGCMSGRHHSVHVLVFSKQWRVEAYGIWQTRGTSAVSCSISLSVFLSFELLAPLSSSHTLTTGLHSHTHFSNLEPCMSQILIDYHTTVQMQWQTCSTQQYYFVSPCCTFIKYIYVYITYSTPPYRAFQDVFWCCCTGAMQLCDGYIYGACCIGLCVTALYIHVFECANAVVFLRLLSPFTITTSKIILLVNVKHFCL